MMRTPLGLVRGTAFVAAVSLPGLNREASEKGGAVNGINVNSSRCFWIPLFFTYSFISFDVYSLRFPH